MKLGFNALILLALTLCLSCSSNLIVKRTHRSGFHFKGFTPELFSKLDKGTDSSEVSDAKQSQVRWIQPKSTLNFNVYKNGTRHTSIQDVRTDFKEFSVVANKNDTIASSAIRNAEEQTTFKNEKESMDTNHKGGSVLSSNIVNSLVVGFGVLLLTSVLNRSRIFKSAMKVNRWASKNKNLGRAGLVVCHIGSISAGFIGGSLLNDLGVTLPSINGKIVISGGMFFLAASSLVVNKKSFFRKKLQYAILPVAVLMASIGAGNSSDELLLSQSSNEISTFSNFQSVNETSRGVVARGFSKATNSKSSPDSGIEIVGKVFLTLLVIFAAILLLYGVIYLSCSLACAGSGALSLLVLFGGIAFAIVLISFLTRKIWKKGQNKKERASRKKEKNTASEKKGTASKNKSEKKNLKIFGRIMIGILLAILLLVSNN